MEQLNMSRRTPRSDDAVSQQQFTPDDIQRLRAVGSMPQDSATEKADALSADLADLFGDDSELAALFNISPSSSPSPFTPSPLEELPLSFNNTTSTRSKTPQEHFRYPAPQELANPILEQPTTITKSRKINTEETKSVITEQQLRALTRKHLLMMIRDLERELSQVKRERDNLLLAYQSGFAQKTQGD